MNINRNTARTMGLLYILGTVAGILSYALTDPIRATPDLLVSVSAHETQLILGALAVLTMGLVLAMIPVVAFPVLRKHNETLALAYVIFRGGLEAVTYIAMVVSWLLLLPLSSTYARASTPDTANFLALGDLLLETEALSYVLTIVFCLGALTFYAVLYQSRLIPRWLSGLGFLTVVLNLTTGLLPLFGVLEPMSTTAVVLELPLALHEMFLALWLIVKGFNPATAQAPTPVPQAALRH